MSFLWYDYETLGRSAFETRPAQFFGIRTDDRLVETGSTGLLYCRPSLDYLPEPQASAIHGITTRKLITEGVSEDEFARRIHRELSQAGTCAVAYNGNGFDHHVSRFLFWRTLRDPYTWHFQNGNSKWDILDLLRAVHAFRPTGLEWPTDDEDIPVFSLHRLAEANGVLCEPAHSADADVRTMISLAQLIKSKQPRLFDYHYRLRNKLLVREKTANVFVYVSGSIPAKRGCTTLMEPLSNEYSSANRLITYDLSFDPRELSELSVPEMVERFCEAERFQIPLRSIALNSAPFVLEAAVANKMVRSSKLKQRFGLNLKDMRRNLRFLRSRKELREHLVEAWETKRATSRDADPDPDVALYNGFVPNLDRAILRNMLQNDPTFAGAALKKFQDERIPVLISRFRARNFSDALSESEERLWLDHCQRRHLTPDVNGETPMDSYFESIHTLRAKDPQREDLWEDLERFGNAVLSRLTS